MERVQTLLLRRIIWCKCTVPQPIIRTEFGVHPLRLEVIFHLVSFLHRVRDFRDSATGRDMHPYLAVFSSEAITSAHPMGRAWGWYSKASQFLQSVTISLKHLPPFKFSRYRAISGHLRRYWISSLERISIGCSFRSLVLHLRRAWAQRCPTLSTSWSFRMASLSAPHAHTSIGCTPSRFLWDNSKWDLIDFGWRLTIIYHDLRGFSRCVTCRSQR